MVLTFISILGILGGTILFPMLAALMGKSSQRNASPRHHPSHVAVLIPAHNEEDLLPVTLTSIQSALTELHKYSACTFRIIVGADGCTDSTEALSARMGAEVVSMPSKTGKWGTISALIRTCSETDYVILADCGVEWPQDFLTRLLPLLRNEDVIGVAPTYRNDTSGIIEKIVWGTERTIKQIEAKSGGPVSVHGATVCYRTEELCRALDFLSQHQWLNDDVVIPLTLRALYPTKRIEYGLSLTVAESAKPPSNGGSEFRRRRRLVLGNIQWITLLWGPIWRINRIAALLACRRVFRLLWAYWVVFTALAVAYYSRTFEYASSPHLLGALVCAAIISFVSPLKNIFQSGWASVLAPYYFTVAIVRAPDSHKETQWN